jgi:hypothetical protein
MERDPNVFLQAFLGAVPTTLFLLMPVFALLLKVCYLGTGRRYLEHLVVALYSHAYLLIVLLAMFLFSWLSGARHSHHPGDDGAVGLDPGLPVPHPAPRVRGALGTDGGPVYGRRLGLPGAGHLRDPRRHPCRDLALTTAHDTPAVVYEVNIDLDATLRAEYLHWLAAHVAEICALPGFTGAQILEVTDPPAAPGRAGLCVQYRLVGPGALGAYLDEHAPRLRAEGVARFGGHFSASRRVLAALTP